MAFFQTTVPAVIKHQGEQMFQLSSERRHAWLKAISREGLNGKKLNNKVSYVLAAPYAYIGPYAYVTSHMGSHMGILIWDANTRMGQQFVPYEYFVCMFYFITGFGCCCYK